MRDAGWFSDERDPTLARWHDGTSWTEHTMVKADWRGTGSPPPPADVRPAGPAIGRSTAAPGSSGPRGSRPARPASSGLSARLRSLDRRLRVVGLVAVVLLVGLGARALLGGDDDGPVSTTSGERTYGADWVTPDGGSYRITITPAATTSRSPSAEGCIGAPPDGRTNLTFTVEIENLGDARVPLPHVTFGANLSSGGSVDPAITTVDGASSAVEIAPLADDSSCDDAREIGLDAADALDPDKKVAFEGVIGGVASPVPSGVALLVHYVQGAPGDTTGGEPMELLAPFPSGG